MPAQDGEGVEGRGGADLDDAVMIGLRMDQDSVRYSLTKLSMPDSAYFESMSYAVLNNSR